MKSLQKKCIYFICTACLILPVMTVMAYVFGIHTSAAESGASRHIYIIYDNSGSMQEKEKNVDSGKTAWQQAAYGVELIASMLEEEDVLTIYFMKDEGDYYYSSTYSITDGNLQEELDQLHADLESLNDVGNTYKNGYMKAKQDIEGQEDGTDNVFLLIFSDGEFNHISDTYDSSTIDLAELPDYVQSINFALGTSPDLTGVIGATQTLETVSDNEDALAKFIQSANYIYDMQEIITPAEHSDGSLTVDLELPADRLVIVAQTEDGGVSEEQMAVESADPELANVQSVVNSGLDGSYTGVVNIYEPAGDYIPAGTYSFSVPTDNSVEISVFTEYVVEYTICLKNSAGKEWVVEEEDADREIRSGEYSLSVRLKNVQTGESLEESSLYDDGKMKVDLLLSGSGNGEDAVSDQGISGRDTEGIYLEEGTYFLSGTIELEGNFSQNVEYSFDVLHQLGDLELVITVPEGGLNLDLLEEKSSAVSVALYENGVNISSLDGLELTVDMDGSVYECSWEPYEEGWYLYPAFSADYDGKENPADSYRVRVTVAGEWDGQEILAEGSASIPFYAVSGKVTFMNHEYEVDDWLKWIFQEENLLVVPLVNGESIDNNKWVSVQSYDFIDDPDIGLSIVDVSGDTEEFKIKFRNPAAWLRSLVTLWEGGTINGQLTVSVNRYGAVCEGSGTVSIKFGRMGMMSWLIFGVAVFLLVYILLCNVILKLIFRNRLWFLPVYVQFSTVVDGMEHNLTCRIRKCWFQNLFRLRSPRAKVLLGKVHYLGFSDNVPSVLWIGRIPGGRFEVKNMDEFKDNTYVRKNGNKLDKMFGEFSLEEGLEWELLGDEDGVTTIQIYGRR